MQKPYLKEPFKKNVKIIELIRRIALVKMSDIFLQLILLEKNMNKSKFIIIPVVVKISGEKYDINSAFVKFSILKSF